MYGARSTKPHLEDRQVDAATRALLTPAQSRRGNHAHQMRRHDERPRNVIQRQAERIHQTAHIKLPGVT